MILRHDNADVRLTPIAHQHGLVDSERWKALEEKTAALDRLRQHTETASLEGIKIAAWLRRPDNSAANLPASSRANFDTALWDAVEIDLKYEGYIMRQNIAIDRLRRQEDKKLPAQLDYLTLHGLRVEAMQRLAAIRSDHAVAMTLEAR